MSNNESKVERYLKDSIKAIGGLTRKWTSPGYTGVPDQIVIKSTTVAEEIYRLSYLDPKATIARVSFVEVKTETGKLSPWQEREIKRLRDAGCEVIVVYGKEQVREYVKQLE